MKSPKEASCNCETALHGRGVETDRNGPAAPALTIKASDLRVLPDRYGEPLPQDQIARFIDGRADVVAHGPRDMPVWGDRVGEFPDGKRNSNQVSTAWPH
jgi:hypothetical protein